MTNDELREKIALAKGYMESPKSPADALAKGWRPVSKGEIAGMACIVFAHHSGSPIFEPPLTWKYINDYPDYPNDIAAAWELEGEIPSAEVERYVLELTRIINAKDDFSTSQRWQLIHATPRERCLAYLAWKAAQG